jgi:hypothetical protein
LTSITSALTAFVGEVSEIETFCEWRENQLGILTHDGGVARNQTTARTKSKAEGSKIKNQNIWRLT